MALIYLFICLFVCLFVYPIISFVDAHVYMYIYIYMYTGAPKIGVPQIIQNYTVFVLKPMVLGVPPF